MSVPLHSLMPNFGHMTGRRGISDCPRHAYPGMLHLCGRSRQQAIASADRPVAHCSATVTPAIPGAAIVGKPRGSRHPESCRPATTPFDNKRIWFQSRDPGGWLRHRGYPVCAVGWLPTALPSHGFCHVQTLIFMVGWILAAQSGERIESSGPDASVPAAWEASAYLSPLSDSHLCTQKLIFEFVSCLH